MTPEQVRHAEQWLKDIDDGSPSLARITAHLKGILLSDPNEFWDRAFELLECSSPISVQADRLLRSGAVHAHTQVRELSEIMAADHEEEVRRKQGRVSNSTKGVHE